MSKKNFCHIRSVKIIFEQKFGYNFSFVAYVTNKRGPVPVSNPFFKEFFKVTGGKKYVLEIYSLKFSYSFPFVMENETVRRKI
jgi:hypothetical protein